MNAHSKPTQFEANASIAETKAINLALQGGGSHSAFTWGVLDRLLEDERLSFEGITTTGAGSINAVLNRDMKADIVDEFRLAATAQNLRKLAKLIPMLEPR